MDANRTQRALEPTALEIRKECYARSEIGREEYEEMRQTLKR